MQRKLGGRLGAFLLTKGLVTEAQLERALELQRERGLALPQILMDLGYVSSQQLSRAFPQMSLVDVVQDAELRHFADSFLHRRYQPGDVIFHQGDVGNEAYVVVQGTVRIVLETGPELAVLQPGELFGEIALLDGDPRTATALAGPDGTEVMVLTRSAFLEQIRKNANLAIDVFKLFARRIRKMTGRAAASEPDPATLSQSTGT